MILQGAAGKIHVKLALSAVISPSIKIDTYLRKGVYNSNFKKKLQQWNKWRNHIYIVHIF